MNKLETQHIEQIRGLIFKAQAIVNVAAHCLPKDTKLGEPSIRDVLLQADSMLDEAAAELESAMDGCHPTELKSAA